MNQQLIGTWRLVSWNQVVDGIEVPFFGPGTEGLLVYTDDGHMSAQLMAADRPRMGMSPEAVRRLALNLIKPWKSREVIRGVRALLNYIRSAVAYNAYAGTYDVEGDEVVHHVELSLIPDWTGGDQRRRFRFAADHRHLVLTVAPVDGEGEHILTWRRP